LRKWLNNDFLNSAFTPEQLAIIALTNLVNNNNAKYGTYGGNPTQDKIFLLSIDEAEKYFASDSDQGAENTAYAEAMGADTNSKGMGWWWLRSPGDDAARAARVFYGGSVYEFGPNVDNDYDAVRPALWLEQ